MRIPVLDTQRVSSTPVRAPHSEQSADRGYGALQHAANQVGGAVDAGLSVAGAAYKEEQHRVEQARIKVAAVDANNGLTEYTREETTLLHGSSDGRGPSKLGESGDQGQGAADLGLTGPARERSPGFFDTQGEHAVKTSGETLKALEDRRQEIASKRGSDEAKKLFLEDSARMLERSRASVEAYTGKQRRVAEIASLETRKAAQLEALRANPYDVEAVDKAVRDFDGPIHVLSVSDEAAAGELKAWAGSVAATQIDALLDRKDWQSAETTLKNRGALLADRDRDRLGKAIELAKGSAGAQSTAGELLSASLRPDGSVDERVLLEGLRRVPDDRRAKVEEALTPLKVQARQAYDADTSRLLSRAQAEFNAKGWTGMSEETKEALNNREDDVRGPQLYYALKHHDQQDLDRLERKSRIRANDAQARREQAELDKIAENQWETKLRMDPDADIKFFLATHGGLSDHVPSGLANLQSKAQKVRDAGLTASQGEFGTRALNEANGYLPNVVGTPKQRADATIAREAFRTRAERAYQGFVIKEKRAPTDAEAADIIAKQIGYAPKGSGSNVLVPHTDESSIREGERLLKQATPKPAKVEVVDPDGKVWKVDADGLDKWLSGHKDWKRR